MFIYCTPNLSVMTNLRCGHTNMYHYFDLIPYSSTGYTIQDWGEHHNPIAILRNPLDRVVSAEKMTVNRYINNSRREMFFIEHSRPYMHAILAYDFRIIDFYDFAQYIPRRSELIQSYRTDSRVGDNITPQDIHVENSEYTLQELQQEFDTYKELMMTQEKITVAEWKELTK